MWAVSGGNGGGVTPVPIPNTAVKPSSADGTTWSPRGRVGRRRISSEGPGILAVRASPGPFVVVRIAVGKARERRCRRNAREAQDEGARAERQGRAVRYRGRIDP